MNRLVTGLVEELRPHGVASPAVSPGWTDENHWQGWPALARTESPRYLGRAVTALAGNPRVLQKGGAVHLVADLAREYEIRPAFM